MRSNSGKTAKRCQRQNITNDCDHNKNNNNNNNKPYLIEGNIQQESVEKLVTLRTRRKKLKAFVFVSVGVDHIVRLVFNTSGLVTSESLLSVTFTCCFQLK